MAIVAACTSMIEYGTYQRNIDMETKVIDALHKNSYGMEGTKKVVVGKLEQITLAVLMVVKR